MPEYLKDYGTTLGPLDFPMSDRAARTLDALLKSLPRTREFEYRHAVVTKAPTEVNPGQRSDVSWISTESPDRVKDVVLARGMNDSQFQANPLVTLGHAYHLPPVGRSLWRKRVRDGDLVGIKAKTQYPAKPADWPAGQTWASDVVFGLIRAGLLQGKSIGFLPLKVHVPDEKEYKARGWPSGAVQLVIDEWLLLEYACVYLPANQDALVESVSKGLEVPEPFLRAMGAACRSSGEPHVSSFLTLEEIERHVQKCIDAVDVQQLAEKAVCDALERLRGRV
jgi:hypothetical protein